MAMNWSMTNAKVLEQEGEQGRPAPESEEELKHEKSIENMERIVLQSEVTSTRTCLPRKRTARRSLRPT
eukprot:13590057-Heterocapsa_arctica.AAC.1